MQYPCKEMNVPIQTLEINQALTRPSTAFFVSLQNYRISTNSFFYILHLQKIVANIICEQYDKSKYALFMIILILPLRKQNDAFSVFILAFGNMIQLSSDSH